MTTPTPTVIEEARKMAWPLRNKEAFGEPDKAAWMAGRYDANGPIQAFIAAIEFGERRAETAVVGWLLTLDRDEWYPHNVAEFIERGDHRSKPA